MKASLISLGCKVNQAEIEKWGNELQVRGWELVRPNELADLYIINACTVTALADKKSRQKVRQVLKANPHAFLIVTGCLTSSQVKFFKNLKAPVKVVETFSKNSLIKNIPFILNKNPRRRKITYRTRSLVKIQDGCNNYCAYCIIPYIRGKERSVPLPQILEEIKEKIRRGYREIVLTGINLGRYRWWDSKGKQTIKLVDLLEIILQETEVPRLRLSSIEPVDFDLRILNLFKDKRICRHLHLPLQSGSDRLLRKMGRNYRTIDFQNLVTKAKNAIPGVAITSDVIVGLPGETAEDFRNTYNLIKAMRLSKIHVFRYSPRPYTKARLMPGQIDPHIKKIRSEKLRQLNKNLMREFQKQFLGQVVPVLFEEKKNGYWRGLSDNYLRVLVKSRYDLFNKIQNVILKEITKEGIQGEIHYDSLT